MQNYVTYEEFGAVGDGKSEDFAAIYRAHEHANAMKLPVRAKNGAKYYIHNTYVDGEVKTARIMTDVDWTGAEIIIDDSDLDFTVPELSKMAYQNIFTVCSDHDVVTFNQDNAKELLESGFYSVSEVAMRCGFDDVSYLCRFFKKHTGLTPLEFAQNGI
jgi:hypothetical protein